MSDVFDPADDETLPTTGEEIGAAVSGAIEALGQGQREIASDLSRAMTQAVADAISSIPKVEPVKAPPRVLEWRCEDIEYKLIDGIRRPSGFTLKAKVVE